MVLLPMTLGNP